MDGLIWDPLDEGIIKTLEKVTLQDLAEDAGKRQHGDNYMFYI
jgi:DNA-binding IscR family transcriptional regulator